MSVRLEDLNEDDPPLTRRERLAAKASLLIVGFLCVTPAALFPVGLLYKIYTHFFP